MVRPLNEIWRAIYIVVVNIIFFGFTQPYIMRKRKYYIYNIVLFLIIIFLVFFSSCVGPVFWTYMSEIFPNRIRGTALSIPVFTQWVFNALVVLVFPAMLKHLSTALTFGILSAFALGQLLFTIKYMKETKGKSLEEIEYLWK